MLSCSVVSDFLRPHGLEPARLPCPWRFSRKEYWSGLSFPSSGDLPNPGMEPRSPALQADLYHLSHSLLISTCLETVIRTSLIYLWAQILVFSTFCKLLHKVFLSCHIMQLISLLSFINHPTTHLETSLSALCMIKKLRFLEEF